MDQLHFNLKTMEKSKKQKRADIEIILRDHES